MDETTRQFLKDFIDNKFYDELYENIKIMIKAETGKAVKDQAERWRQKEIWFLTAEQERKIIDSLTKSMAKLIWKWNG